MTNELSPPQISDRRGATFKMLVDFQKLMDEPLHPHLDLDTGRAEALSSERAV